MTIPLGSYPGPGRAASLRALFALHRTGFGEPPRRRDAGGLLPHRFTLTARISGDTRVAVSFLCRFPSAFAAWLAPASCPSVSGLSSTRNAPRSPGLHIHGSGLAGNVCEAHRPPRCLNLDLLPLKNA